MSRRLFWNPLLYPLLLAVLVVACAGLQAHRESLPRAVKAYNTFLRWKKYDSATNFRATEDQAEFAARYLAAEDDLHVESIEVRSVAWPEVAEGEPPVAVVTVVALAYLLPSTIQKKIIMQQRWEYSGGRWLVVGSDRELVPKLEPPPEETPAPGEPDPPEQAEPVVSAPDQG